MSPKLRTVQGKPTGITALRNSTRQSSAWRSEMLSFLMKQMFKKQRIQRPSITQNVNVNKWLMQNLKFNSDT
jgi:hypothetical protein